MQQQSTSLCDTKYKIVFLGDMGVGKTSIIERFVKDQFDQFNNPTVGIDFLTRNISYQNKTYRLQLWDTAGQEKYKSLVPAYLRDASSCVFVFDFMRKQSFENLPSWIQLYRDFGSEKSVGFILDFQQQVKDFARKENMTFRKVSAKTGKDVIESFQNMIEQVQKGKGKNNLEAQLDPQTKYQNEILQKIDKLKLEDAKKGNTSCCYI